MIGEFYRMKLLLNNISKSFDHKCLFKEAKLTFEQGKIYGLLGRNGAGKTSLFQCIAKNIQLDAGEIKIEDDAGNVHDYAESDIGFLHTQPKLPDFMTGYEFIQFFMGIHQSEVDPGVTPEYLLLNIGIDVVDQHRLLKDYSHGMKNKVQLLAIFMLKPKVLLLDEPLTSFDVVAAHEIKQMIMHKKQESIIIFSTHILQLAQDMCDEIVLLHHKDLHLLPPQDLKQADFEDEIIKLLSEPDEEVS